VEHRKCGSPDSATALLLDVLKLQPMMRIFSTCLD
jgi:hypothetical protein